MTKDNRGKDGGSMDACKLMQVQIIQEVQPREYLEKWMDGRCCCGGVVAGGVEGQQG